MTARSTLTRLLSGVDAPGWTSTNVPKIVAEKIFRRLKDGRARSIMHTKRVPQSQGLRTTDSGRIQALQGGESPKRSATQVSTLPELFFSSVRNRAVPRYRTYVLKLFSLRIELRIWPGPDDPPSALYISFCGEPPLEEGKTRVRWKCVSFSLSIIPCVN